MPNSPDVSRPAPPVAERRPHVLEAHGHRRVDDYYWLRHRDDPAVIAYLESENAYTASATRHLAALRDTLFDEIVGRIPDDDEDVPHRRGDWWYYRRFVEGGEYPIHCRRPDGAAGDEQIVLDVNRLAEGAAYYSAAGVSVSPGHRVLAWAYDDVGRRRYTLRFKDLLTGETFPERIEDVSPGVAWAADDRTVFYVRKHPQTLRPWQVWRHELGTEPAQDVPVYEETDEEFLVAVGTTKSREYVAIVSHQTVTSEWRVLRADDPRGEFRVVEPRRRGHEYDVDHLEDRFYIRTNRDAPNFRLVSAPVDDAGADRWTEVIAHRDDALLEDVELFRDHLVAVERREGLTRLRVLRRDGFDDHEIGFDDPAWVVVPFDNFEIDTTVLRFAYASLATPDSVYDYDLVRRTRTRLKRKRVVGGFDPDAYVTERLHATARDGAIVPISLVRRRDVEPDGTAPLLLYGYGAYGHSVDPSFSIARLSLLDRGFVFAIAHVRGGEDLGRTWYDGGRLLDKPNTFNDFIDCAEHLIADGHAAANRLFATGGSAGGLLMGAVANMRPDLWAGIVARVPFVDVVTTMLDPSIPLTTFEYDEWGNPGDPEFYRAMLAYSPYDNVEPKAYPAMLVTAGLHDSQVQYWEPAKWVARLRATKTDDRPLLLHVEMEAGHGGASGRFRVHRETALTQAFLLDLAGVSS